MIHILNHEEGYATFLEQVGVGNTCSIDVRLNTSSSLCSHSRYYHYPCLPQVKAEFSSENLSFWAQVYTMWVVVGTCATKSDFSLFSCPPPPICLDRLHPSSSQVNAFRNLQLQTGGAVPSQGMMKQQQEEEEDLGKRAVQIYEEFISDRAPLQVK